MIIILYNKIKSYKYFKLDKFPSSGGIEPFNSLLYNDLF